MSDFKLHILGCGSALPTSSHYPTSQVVEYRDRLYMIDCGEGAQRLWRKQRLDFGHLVAIFISHLHGDHCYGLPGLLSTLGLLGRRRALPIYGPRGLKRFLDYYVREGGEILGYEVIIHEHPDGVSQTIYEDRTLEVKTLPLDHRCPCAGFLFQERSTQRHIDRASCDFYGVPQTYYPSLRAGEDFIHPDGSIIANAKLTRPGQSPRSYAYCSDTAFKPSLAPLIQGVNLLYHEATFPTARAARAKETYHSTASEAAELAKLAGVDHLLIGHYSARYSDPTPLLDEAREVFPQTTAADEGMTIDI